MSNTKTLWQPGQRWAQPTMGEIGYDERLSNLGHVPAPSAGEDDNPAAGAVLFNKIYKEGVVYPKDERSKARKVAWLDLDWSKYGVCHVVWMPDGAQ